MDGRGDQIVQEGDDGEMMAREEERDQREVRDVPKEGRDEHRHRDAENQEIEVIERLDVEAEQAEREHEVIGVPFVVAPVREIARFRIGGLVRVDLHVEAVDDALVRIDRQVADLGGVEPALAHGVPDGRQDEVPGRIVPHPRDRHAGGVLRTCPGELRQRVRHAEAPPGLIRPEQHGERQDRDGDAGPGSGEQGDPRDAFELPPPVLGRTDSARWTLEYRPHRKIRQSGGAPLSMRQSAEGQSRGASSRTRPPTERGCVRASPVPRGNAAL